MPPVLAVRQPVAGVALERGQTTLLSVRNGRIGLQRPPASPRPGPTPVSSGQSNTLLGRRLIGGVNEKRVLTMFTTQCLT